MKNILDNMNHSERNQRSTSVPPQINYIPTPWPTLPNGVGELITCKCGHPIASASDIIQRVYNQSKDLIIALAVPRNKIISSIDVWAENPNALYNAELCCPACYKVVTCVNNAKGIANTIISSEPFIFLDAFAIRENSVLKAHQAYKAEWRLIEDLRDLYMD